MLSFVSSPGSIAEMQENWFPAQTCPSLVAAKGMLHEGSTASFFESIDVNSYAVFGYAFVVLLHCR
jgi:hypothetical protein